MNTRFPRHACVRLSWALSLALLANGAATAAGSDMPPDAARCAALATEAAAGREVLTAQWQPDAPSHCLVRLMVDRRPSALPELGFGTGIEVRLPRDWNGRLFFQGGGGMNGVQVPALGRIAGSASALDRGFAVVATDSGHQGRSNIDSRFGLDQQARLDFAYQGVARATREAKTLLARYYGRNPERSYFVGCSTGGREAMLVAQRLPMEFDGVVAGNAAWNLTRLVANQVWSLQAVHGIAPRGADGRADLSQAFTDTQLKAITDTALQRCDALDGLRDGLINDYKACRLDARQFTCGSAGAPGAGQCLAPRQAETLAKIMGGARNSRGDALYGDFAWDTGLAGPAWRGMHLGTQGRPPANATLGADTLRNYVLTPADPDFDPLKFDFDRDMDRTAWTASINDATGTEHSSFAARGSKLIVYHGLSDQAMSTGALTAWYEQLTPRQAAGAQDWARLFLVPGMTHCAGGQSTDQFDMLAAVQAWVEQGRAPERVRATGTAFPGRSRPLCPYPPVARYDGGNPEDERSFSCR